METKNNLFAAQAGYVIAKHYQPVLRFALIDDDENETKTREVTGGLSVYCYGHKLKFQTDATMLHTEIGEVTVDNTVVRAQFQLVF